MYKKECIDLLTLSNELNLFLEKNIAFCCDKNRFFLTKEPVQISIIKNACTFRNRTRSLDSTKIQKSSSAVRSPQFKG